MMGFCLVSGFLIGCGGDKKEPTKEKSGAEKSAAKESEGDGKHYAGWGRDFQKGLEQAKQENKSVLVLFTGSDWCPPCKMLHEQVFTTSEFKSEIADSVVLVVCDNPRDDSLTTPEEQAQYEKLAPQFNVSGVPSLFLTDASGEPYHSIVGYGGESASEWVADLKSMIKAGSANP